MKYNKNVISFKSHIFWFDFEVLRKFMFVLATFKLSSGIIIIIDKFLMNIFECSVQALLQMSKYTIMLKNKTKPCFGGVIFEKGRNTRT